MGAEEHAHSHDGPQPIGAKVHNCGEALYDKSNDFSSQGLSGNVLTIAGHGFFPVDAEGFFSVPTQEPEVLFFLHN